ncbi:hypothetical protein LMG28614_05681 [Paraburkholderia ultramafica]|uniref:SMODS and SLOG-associating 2TM effector domain-containing protein n=1 Tax=Paraburkholderia ultramafica TaxID=1544867 RepID=A0A6S7BU55_9BURK|nr:hypothetical protein [Paraburkholderia ultramafica]CAB3802721.1 hypothetical protein LMG28614_05681 [Paraburkholderia ultramafica]
MPRTKSPVWTVYNKLRTARLNVKYYCCRLESIERQNFILELILLASAPTSAIAGLWFWQEPYGQSAWKFFGVVAAVAAVLKPLLGLTKKIKNMESVVVGYKALEYDLMEIVSLIEQKRKYDATQQADLKRAIAKEKALVVQPVETRERKKVKAICEAEVRRELPDDYFFVPEEPHVISTQAE